MNFEEIAEIRRTVELIVHEAECIGLKETSPLLMACNILWEQIARQQGRKLKGKLDKEDK